MQNVQLTLIDYAILLIYVAFVVGIGFALRRYMKSSSDFLTSGRSIPAWVTGLAFISANLGALELVGMAASGAKYGIATSHFYWVGAIPAMVFLAVFMMPFYYGSKARSVPEYLKMRFDERTRALNSVSFAVMTVFASGISMNALAKLLHQLLGWNYDVSLWICSGVVLLYVLKGGLTSAIYTEVLQFFMIVLGFAPVVYLGLKDVGGWDALKSRLADVAQNPAAAGMIDKAGKTFAPDSWTSAWGPLLHGSSANPMGVDLFAMVFGLGFVLSFGYWCTNFLVVQRAMAARNMGAARRTPLIAAVPKMLFPALVILPGMLAAALAFMGKDGYRLPPKPLDSAIYEKMVSSVTEASTQGLQGEAAFQFVNKAIGEANAAALKLNQAKIVKLVSEKAAQPMLEAAAQIKAAEAQTGKEAVAQLAAARKTYKEESAKLRDRLQDSVSETDYDGVILSLVKRYCPPGLLGLALTGLLASFMSGMAGNVTAFNTVWTYDLYQSARRALVDTPRPHVITFPNGRQEEVVITPKEPSDNHFLWMGRAATVAGILLSIVCAYLVSHWSNAMDIIQLVFGFVNAPLFATFLLGMFWKRTTSQGAFYGLLGGTLTSASFHALTSATGNAPGIKGGYISVVQIFPSDMAQNFWLATFAFLACFTLTFVISLCTRRTKTDEDLKGLVYSLTPKLKDEEKAWYMRPAPLGIILISVCIILNFIFR